jgi:hypothetical protein
LLQTFPGASSASAIQSRGLAFIADAIGPCSLNFVRCVFLDCGKGCALKQNLRRIASLFKIAQTAFEMRRTVWSSGKVETT